MRSILATPLLSRSSGGEILDRPFHRVESRPSRPRAGWAARVASVSEWLAAAVCGSKQALLLVKFWASFTLVLCFGCGSPVSVRAAYDPSAPFLQYRTFAMLEPNRAVPTGLDSDPFVMRELRQLTYHALVRRGLQPVALDQADVAVGVLARFQQKVEVGSSPAYSHYGYGSGYGPRYGGPWGGWGPQQIDEYSEAQVAIDLIDPKANEVRWRGMGSRRADRDLTSAEMSEIVERILSQFPPGKAK